MLSAVLAAGRAQQSVHYVSIASAPRIGTTIVGDAARREGIQQITFRRSGRTGHVTVMVIARTAYVRGDAFTLANYMGIKPSAAARYANSWILIPRSDSGYSTVAAAVTLASAIDELKLSRPLAKVPVRTINGQLVIGISGKDPTSPGGRATATLYARATGTPLPVREQTRLGTGRISVTFSRWNEPVQLRAPAHAVPIAKVETG